MNKPVRILALLKRCTQDLHSPLRSFERTARVTLITFAWFSFFVVSANGADLQNYTISLKLGFTPSGTPLIEKAVWLKTGEAVFVDTLASDSLQNWVPEKFIPESLPPVDWSISSDANFYRGEVTRELRNGLRLTWIVELAKTGATFRLKMRMHNSSNEALNIKWFPTWNANWEMDTAAQWVKWWQALSYTQDAKDLSSNGNVTLGSHLHSSDFLDEGANPYWVVGGETKRMFFGLEWCGGWEATMSGQNGAFSFNVRLPQNETQLELEPDGAIEGPTLWVTPTTHLDEPMNRRSWMLQRRAIAKRLYRGSPPRTFPLTYNTWYASEFDVDGNFLQRQIDALEPYGFHAFIIDAGWYEKPGKWKAKRSKFQPNELEELLATLTGKGIKAGLWSAPQLVNSSATPFSEDVNQLSVFNDFISGYLIDLAGADYLTQLTDHVSALQTNFSMEWWKYDQPLFIENSRQGVMKNVVAFQEALRAVRLQNPTLTIENCQNGGRMINELTALTSQAIWLRDGSKTKGLEHARQNVEVALGAVEFLFPWTAYCFTKNFDLLDPNDDDLTRLYCRSAMAGTWGISSDLSAISERQKKIILKEAKYYRLLNDLKLYYLYDIEQPAPDAEAASITFYDAKLQRAGLLIYRWDAKGAFKHRLKLKMIDPTKTYRVCDTDAKTEIEVSGEDLMNQGIDVLFGAQRLSAVLFIEPVDELVN
jgi:alpha-galactosidase